MHTSNSLSLKFVKNNQKNKSFYHFYNYRVYILQFYSINLSVYFSILLHLILKETNNSQQNQELLILEKTDSLA